MSIGFKMDGDVDHENLVIASATLIALDFVATLKELSQEKIVNLSAEQMNYLAESLTFGLAAMFDGQHIAVNGKKYLPRIAFIDEDGNVLPGAAEMDFMHEYSASPLMDLDDLEIMDD